MKAVQVGKKSFAGPSSALEYVNHKHPKLRHKQSLTSRRKVKIYVNLRVPKDTSRHRKGMSVTELAVRNIQHVLLLY
ncbi:Protein of unknown function [Gryllus bimaculatus]|nr:Protein of unknown function [Gryllus bimaculatus]